MRNKSKLIGRICVITTGVSKHIWRIFKHKYYVLKIGLTLRKELNLKLPIWNLIVHDNSKLAYSEFSETIRRIKSNYSYDYVNNYGFLYHQNNCRHHPEYWTLRHFSSNVNKQLVIPEIYVNEMIVDWMASSTTNVNTTCMTNWLSNNLPAILSKLQTENVKQVRSLLIKLGYSDVVRKIESM